MREHSEYILYLMRDESDAWVKSEAMVQMRLQSNINYEYEKILQY